MDRELVAWKDPAARLRQALERDELEIYLQPIASLADARFAMAEVLVRLREEEARMLPPGEFLPLFEQLGMMPELDRWVIARMVQRLAHRPPAGFRCLNVNVSGQTIADPEVPGFVSRTLSDSRIAPDSLCFEIDEADVLARLDTAAVFAARVRRLGCKVAIDGFGRCAAPFSPLRRLQVDYLKVEARSRAIWRAARPPCGACRPSCALAKTVGIGVIAECVEEPDVLARLRALGVGYAQGFGIARPAPMENA